MYELNFIKIDNSKLNKKICSSNNIFHKQNKLNNNKIIIQRLQKNKI